MSVPPLAAEAMSLYDHAPARDRLHVKGRWKSCPVAAVEAQVPRAGRILDVGCGHGLVSAYLALAAPERRVVGTDVDLRKLDIARHAAGHLDETGTRLAFVDPPGDGSDDTVLPGPWDAIVIVDVIYLLDRDAQRRMLARAAGELEPGGTLVVKVTDSEPRWKHLIDKAQETLATKVLRFTQGDELTFPSLAELAADLEAVGLVARTMRCDKGYLHPHAMVVGRKPFTAGD